MGLSVATGNSETVIASWLNEFATGGAGDSVDRRTAFARLPEYITGGCRLVPALGNTRPLKHLSGGVKSLPRIFGFTLGREDIT